MTNNLPKLAQNSKSITSSNKNPPWTEQNGTPGPILARTVPPKHFNHFINHLSFVVGPRHKKTSPRGQLMSAQIASIRLHLSTEPCSKWDAAAKNSGQKYHSGNITHFFVSTHSGIEDTDGMIVVSLLRIITWIYCAKPANTVGQMTEMKLFLMGGAKNGPLEGHAGTCQGKWIVCLVPRGVNFIYCNDAEHGEIINLSWV